MVFHLSSRLAVFFALHALLNVQCASFPWPLNSLGSLNLRRAPATFAVTGINAGGPLHPRLEIRTLQQNADQWNLYLLAMQSFQAMNQSNPLGWYQIAGVHGVPNIPWDNVEANPDAGGAVGYCTHSSVLFPTWHRAYLALFEQAFYACVQNVVASFPQGALHDRYATAAVSIRIPYWDWAQQPAPGQPVIPASITAKYINGLVTPTGTQNNVINPLFRYTFHPLVGKDMIYNPWASWPLTLRYPNSNTSIYASSRPSVLTSVFNSNIKNIRESVYNMFALCNDYATFSNDAASASTPGCYTSLEGVHDNIHTLIGGTNNGHMTWLWWAAFDPVFFLHHANVDRLFAMWQAVYPDSFVSPTPATGNTYTIQSGSIQDQNSPLTPFHSDTQGTFWTSSGVRNMNTFHYTYPEFMTTNGSTPAIIGAIINLYGPSASSGTAASTSSKRATQPNSTTHEYILNVQAQRFGLNGSFAVYAFLGTPPASRSAVDWLLADSLVGSHGFFSNPGMMSHMAVTGAVPLTSALQAQVAAGNLASMQVVDVVPYLQANLVWSVARTLDGAEVPAAIVPGLQISVVTAQATQAESDEAFPTWSQWTTLTNVTRGKPGGTSLG